MEEMDPIEARLYEITELAVERVLRRVLPEILAAEKASAGSELGSEFLTKKAAAALVSVSTSTIGQWIKDGALRRHGRGKRVLISRAELVRAISEPSPPKGASSGRRKRQQRRND